MCDGSCTDAAPRPELTKGQQAAARKLAALLPCGGRFKTRKEAVQAGTAAFVMATGHGCMQEISTASRVVLRCTSAMRQNLGGKATWKGHDLPGFECERRTDEHSIMFKRRRYKMLESYAEGRLCCFKAVCQRMSDNGLGY